MLPNSWKSALVPWLARIPRRTGYMGEFRYGLLNDPRRLDRKALPRLVDRFAALAAQPGALMPMPPAPVLVPDLANRNAAARAMHAASATGRSSMLCPGAEFGPAKRWPPTHFAELAARFLAQGLQVWLVGSPNDKLAASSVAAGAGEDGRSIRDLTGRTDLGTAIDMLSLASVVVSNDSGLMHAAAAVGVPLVALFGSSSPDLHAAAVAARARREDRHRVQSLLQARMPARPLQVHARAGRGWFTIWRAPRCRYTCRRA